VRRPTKRIGRTWGIWSLRLNGAAVIPSVGPEGYQQYVAMVGPAVGAALQRPKLAGFGTREFVGLAGSALEPYPQGDAPISHG
jgi:hypothetical protein